MKAETKPTTTNPSLKLSTIGRIELLSNAWRTCAPEAKFADTNWAQFRSATELSRAYRTKLVTLKLQVRSGVAARNQADKATRALLSRVVAGVKGDVNYGPDSALYRAMGFVPLNERKRPGSPTAAAAPQTRTPSRPGLMERLANIRVAWVENAPNEDFSGISLAQFDEAVAPSSATRAELLTSHCNYAAAMGLRHAADTASLALVRRVVLSIKADVAYGSDSPLYRALGYIPDSERRSARRSATTATTPVAPAQ